MAASLLVTTAANLAPTLTSALAVQIQSSLDISEAEIGLTVSVFFFVGALFSAVSGRFVERIGPVNALRSAAALAGVVLVAVGPLGKSWPALVALTAVAGLANAWAQPAANLYVARGVTTRRQGLALGIQKSGIPTASLIAGLAVPTVGLTIGWRWAFVMAGVLALCVSLGVPSLAPERSRTAAAAAAGRGPRPDLAVGLLATLSVSTCLAAMGSAALGSFFVLSSVEYGIAEAAAGLLLMVGSVVGIASRLIVGSNADRARHSPWKVLVAMYAVAAAAFVTMAAGSAAALLVALPFAFATSFAWPGLFHYAVVQSNPSAPGAATGVTMTGSFIGAVCGPLLFGVLVEQAGYSWAWLFAATTSAAAAFVMAAASRPLRPSPSASSRPETP